MTQISNIQRIINDQNNLDNIRQNILEMNENYDIRFACLNGNTKDISKDSIRKGYFKVLRSYEDINEALKEMGVRNNLLIEEKIYMVGVIYENLNDCLPGIVYNLYTGRKVADTEPIPAYDLDSIRNPIQFMSLYDEISESIPELKSILDNIETPKPYDNPDLNCRKWITETWTDIHNALKEDKIIKDIAYTDFII